MEEQNLPSNHHQGLANEPVKKISEKSSQTFFDNLKPKTAFIVGLVSGVLVICAIGFFILGGILLGQGTGTGQKVGQANNQGNLNVNSNQVAPQYGDPAAVSNDDNKRGGENAKVVLIEYSDFQCPFCQKHHETMKKIMNDFGNQVEWVFRNFPLKQLHPFANKAALASECAAEQGKFWEYADKLFENQSKFSDTYFGQLATELNLKIDQFNSCLNSAKYQSKVDAQEQDGVQAGVSGTPATFINGQLVKGAVPYDQFKSLVENALK